MEIIHNLKELNNLGRDLKYGDDIWFEIGSRWIKYTVLDSDEDEFLSSNDKIFNIFTLAIKEKYKLAEEHCKYKKMKEIPISTYQNKNYKKLKNLIIKIYELSGEKNIKEETLDPILNRFEILDIR